MSGRTEIAFGRTDRFDVIEIPYGGQAFAMTIVLPHVGSDPLDVVGDIDAAGWASLTEGLDTLETNLELPKFEVSWEKAVEDDLAEIGMPDAFDPLAADFTGMVAGGNLWIDQVLQKSFVRVDEAGTVASAATSVHMVDTAFMPMRVDRPFLFAIRERLTGTVLFLGILRDPGA
jgi:serpin B